MIFRETEYELTCRDFDYTGVQCCPTCHEQELSEYELRVVQVDGRSALLCCQLVSFFYPTEPNRGMSPEEKLLRAIFGEKATHKQD
jgi:hypothetical protein